MDTAIAALSHKTMLNISRGRSDKKKFQISSTLN